jgi:hypothetical protein
LTDLITVVAEHGLSAAGAVLLCKVLGKPATVAGEMLADELYVWQWKRRLAACDEISRIAASRGITIRPLPMSFSTPFFEAVGNVEDPELVHLWAGLLVSAVEDDLARHPVFLRLLKDLNADDARILTKLALDGPGVIPTSGAHSVSGHVLPGWQRIDWCVAREAFAAVMSIDASSPEFHICHLETAGLVEVFGDYLQLTDLGAELITCCSPGITLWSGKPFEAGWKLDVEKRS